jgi:hypothetical protein
LSALTILCIEGDKHKGLNETESALLYNYGFVSSTSESAKVNQDFSGQHLLGMYMPTSTVGEVVRTDNSMH